MSKEKPIHLRTLRQDDLAQLYFTFLEAFADYSVDMQLDRKAFERRMLNKLNIDWGLSVGSFSGDKMVGFITHTTNEYQGQLIAYNGGTGVIPSYRGLGLTAHMYALAMKQFREMKINQCVLEVIDSNTHALKAYEDIGFRRTRRLRCYKRTQPVSIRPTRSFSLTSLQTELIGRLDDQLNTSFMDTLVQLTRNKVNEKLLLFQQGEEIIGYCVFNPANGRIARLWVHEDHRRNDIGTELITAASIYADKALTVINVDENNLIAHRFFLACGFENQINQWEMLLQSD